MCRVGVANNAQDKAWDYSEPPTNTYLLWETRNPGDRKSSLGNIPATSEALADPRPSRRVGSCRVVHTQVNEGRRLGYERVARVGEDEAGCWSDWLGGGRS